MEFLKHSKTILSKLYIIESNYLEQRLELNKSSRSTYARLSSVQRVKSVPPKTCATFYHPLFQNDTSTKEFNHILLACYERRRFYYSDCQLSLITSFWSSWRHK